MSQPAITEALVGELLSRWKFIHRAVYDNTQSAKSERRQKDYVEPDEKRIIYEVRFSDMREKDAGLQLHARLEKPLSGVYPRPMPGISLKLGGRRIRGINWNLRHDSMLNAVPVGTVRGWHEKLWTNADGDKYIIDINTEVRNTDLHSMIRFACGRWNIEIPENQIRLGDL